MLRLCPGDNLGQRYSLGSLLSQAGRNADALSFAQAWLTEKTKQTGEPPIRGGCEFKAPHKNVMAVKKEKTCDYVACSILYSAALASFKVFGDCEQSRQYLKLAAKSNPHVLLKILARVQKPESFNNSSRTPNGPEDAHDYLHLTQNLWMEDDVWNWADNHAEAKNTVLKICSREGCGLREVRVAEYKRCSACHLVSYCSVRCQKDDWGKHKPACQNHKQMKSSIRAFQRGKPVSISKDGPFGGMYASDMVE